MMLVSTYKHTKSLFKRSYRECRKRSKRPARKYSKQPCTFFQKKGYLGATTKDIAAESGIAEVTLFRHFAAKENLLEEVLMTYTFVPALKEIIPAVRKMPYEEALVQIARNSWKYSTCGAIS